MHDAPKAAILLQKNVLQMHLTGGKIMRAPAQHMTGAGVIAQGGSPYVKPDQTVHDPKAANGDAELGDTKPVTAPAQQKAVP